MHKKRIAYSTALKKLHPHFQQWHARGRRILVRIDANVPIKNGTIADDYRLLKILPTLHTLREMHATIVLLTHLGRPTTSESSLSTRLLIPWFEKHNFPINFAETIEDAYEKSLSSHNTLLLLENLRFFPGEKNNDRFFAQQLARLGDYYINDAFATLHREDTSITLLAEEFSPEHRSIGLLVEHELQGLAPLIKNVTHPYCVVIGGGKPGSKIALLQHIASYADYLLLCPALVFTFLKSQGQEIGKSLYDKAALKSAQELLNNPQRASLHFPEDYLVSKETIEGPYTLTSDDTLSPTDIGISIGPKTIDRFSQVIKSSQSIFFNCGMGFLNKSETTAATHKLLDTIAQSNSYSVVGGGESVALARHAGFEHAIDFLSTGGGATLTYLANIPLPGLMSIMS